MARTPRSKTPTTYTLPEAAPVPDEEHPGFQNGLISDEAAEQPEAYTPVPGGPLPLPPLPLPRPLPQPLPQPRLPIPQPLPGRIPLPIRICGPVSGRYTLKTVRRPTPWRYPYPIFLTTQVTVRVDVDRFFPQRRISIEVNRLFPRGSAHAIAEVTSDACLGIFQRRVEAQITYRDGDAGLIPGDKLVFEASRSTGFAYSTYKLSLISGGATVRTYDLDFRSRYFDPVEFEVDTVADAGAPVTVYDTGSHPNRPASLPTETISLATVYQRAGFDVSMSPNTTTIPVSGAGANGTWSDAEMHNAMVTYWSRFADRPQWAMWVLFARRHDQGYGLGGIMFDDIGANHRQGTAIFTDSFIQDNPAGDPNPAAWRQRMVFWTAVHEMGHAFNLAHAWQKSLGRPLVDGDPWIPLTDEPESRSFMNYPFRVSGGEDAFFSDFEFRFTDDELVFMRHAPRRFVQMGNEDWFENHGFEQGARAAAGTFRLELRSHRSENRYRFLEPVSLELKLKNESGEAQPVEPDCLRDGRHVGIVVCREGAPARKWRPFGTYCHKPESAMLKPGDSIYGAHFVSASTDGWLIDEPGFYKIQAAVDVNGELVRSNVLRIFVSAAAADGENAVAPDYFSEDVGRVLAFQGAPALEPANDVLRKVIERCATNPAATHAAVALSNPKLRDFKVLKAGATRAELAFDTDDKKIDEGSKAMTAALVKQPDAAADTMGHIPYFDTVDQLSRSLADAGAGTEAATLLRKAVDFMKKRGIKQSVIDSTQRRLARIK